MFLHRFIYKQLSATLLRVREIKIQETFAWIKQKTQLYLVSKQENVKIIPNTPMLKMLLKLAPNVEPSV